MPKQSQALNEYQTRPKHREKFKPSEAREIIRQVLQEKLVPKQQQPPSDLTSLGKQIADQVKSRLKEVGRERYKYVVQVATGFQKGQGVQVGCKNFWDAEIDGMATDNYVDDNIFCLVTVWAVYAY